MWFKELSFYILGEPVSSVDLNAVLTKRPFAEPSGLDWYSEGWVPPADFLADPVHQQGQYAMVALRRDDKVLPGTVIRKELDKAVADIERQEARKVGRKEKLALKEQITDNLLPRAFTKSSMMRAYLDMKRGLAMVGSASSIRAESLISSLREALPPFPCALVRTKRTPSQAMTDWLAASEAVGDFELDADATMIEPEGGKVKVSRTDLAAEEIRQHLATGKQVTRLGLIWRERIRFVLTENLQLKRIQFLDVLQEEASQAGDDRETLFDATMMLMAEELGDLVTDLVVALGGMAEEAA